MKWYVLGAGSMGSLAAHYLQQAGWSTLAANRGAQTRTLVWPQGAASTLTLPADDNGTIKHLLLATKGPSTKAALAPLLPRLAPEGVLIRLQNGMGTLADVPLPPAWQCWEAITTNAAWRAQERITVVAENSTIMGHPTASTPTWFTALQTHWPALQWERDMALQQWLKLTVNALINPLTALYNCPNGALLTIPEAHERFQRLAKECDAIAQRLFPQWPLDTYARAAAVAQATANNCSSMRADMLAQQHTEIDYITGYILAAAAQRGVVLPEHESVYRDIVASSLHFAEA